MEKPIWVVSIDNEIKGYVNSFEEGLDYIKQIGWLDENYNTWQDWLEDFNEEEKEKYPTFDDLYNMPEKDRRNFSTRINTRIRAHNFNNILIKSIKTSPFNKTM